MHTDINFHAKLTQIQRLLDKAEYPDSATRCMLVIEQALRQVAVQYLERVDDQVKQKVQEGVRKRGQKTIDKLTMGQLVYVFQESGFLDACAQTAGKDLSSLSIINLEKLTQLRNKFIHNAQEATPTEAEFLLLCLKVIVITFDLSALPEKQASAPLAADHDLPEQMDTASLPGALHNRIVIFLTSLPTMDDTQAQRALLSSAGLDEKLLRLIDVDGPPGQFFQLLVPILNKYGALQDGRHALQAVLEAAKAYVGQEGRAQCEQLRRELQGVLTGKQSASAQPEAKPAPTINSPNKPPAPPESLDTQILRVLAGYYQQHPGDPEMNIEDVLSALPQHQLPTIQAQLFALKKKGWIGSDLNPEGNAGLVWIEPKGLKIARVNR